MKHGQGHPWSQLLPQPVSQWFRVSGRSLLLGIIATLLVLGVWHQLLVQEHKHLDLLTQQQAATVTASVGKELATHIQGLERMANRWQVGQGTPRVLWEADAKAYINAYPGFQSINWLDSSFHVRWIVPLAGNEAAQNLDASQEPRRRG